MELLRLGVLVSGRGSNLQSIMDACAREYTKAVVTVVLSDNPDAYGLVRAQNAGIDTCVVKPSDYPDRDTHNAAMGEILERYSVGLVCLAGYMRVLAPSFVKKFKNRIINIHPAILPSFPGLHGQEQALNYGVKVSGCTVHFVDEGVDTGPVIIQAVVPVFHDDTDETLSARILEYEHKIYPAAIRLFSEGRLKVESRKVIIEGDPHKSWATTNPPIDT